MTGLLGKRQYLLLILYGIALYFFIRYAFLGWKTDFQTIAINCLFTLPLFGLLLVLFRRLCPAILIHSLLLFAINYLDRFVYACRLTHIRYSDFFSVMDAVRVAGRYRLFFTPYDGILLTSILAFNILLLYQQEFDETDSSFREIASFCNENGVRFITMHVDRWKESFSAIAKENDLSCLVHPVADVSLAKRLISSGVDAVYSFSLSPDDISSQES